jgi:integrase
MSSFKVRIWGLRRLPSGSFRVRWRVAHSEFGETFRTKGLAESFRARLLAAARLGEAFDERSGLPKSMVRMIADCTWFDHARIYARMKWPGLAATSRRSIAEALATVTSALVRTDRGAPDTAALRAALYRWVFASDATSWSEAPDNVRDMLKWLEANSLRMSVLHDLVTVRKALSACGTRQDGRPAAATTFSRKRAVFYNSLGYAVELGLLEFNPIDRIQWTSLERSTTVDRRVVVNPRQAAALIAAVGTQSGATGRRLKAFFGCLYYAAMRPAEGIALEERDCLELPKHAWGRLALASSEPRSGVIWTNDGQAREVRGLKHRGQAEIRIVPIPPELVQLLRAHLREHGTGPGGRLFRTDSGRPVQDSTYTAVWRRARRKVLTEDQVASPLGRRPYDLRHAGISLWLNAGVPVTEIARRAGNGVAVILARYANCVDGEESIMNERISAALLLDRGTLGHDSAAQAKDQLLAAHPWHEEDPEPGSTGKTADGGLA